MWLVAPTLDPAGEGCFCHSGPLSVVKVKMPTPCASLYRNPFPRPFSDVYFTGKTLLYGREIMTLCRNDSSPRKQKDRLAYGKRPTGPKSGVDARAGNGDHPLLPVLEVQRPWSALCSGAGLGSTTV